MTRWTLLPVALLLGACATPALAPASAPERPTSVSAEARIAVQDAAPALASYFLMAPAPSNVLTPNDATTLARIEVWLKRDAGSATLLGSLTGDKRSITLNQLRLDAGYHVQLKGFKSDPNASSPDTAFTMQISADNASSASFRTDPNASGAYLLNTSFSVPLVLTNQVFAGQGDGGITLTPGVLSSTVQAESLATGAL